MGRNRKWRVDVRDTDTKRNIRPTGETAKRGVPYKSRSGGSGGPQRPFYHQKGSRRYGFRRHRRAYSVRVARGAPGNEVKENEEMTGTRTRARARGRGREEKEARGSRLTR